MAPTDKAERLRWERPLIDRARAGDQRAFGELYRAYAPKLFSRVLLPKLGARSAAEDALAETFRTAWERLDRYEEQGRGFYAWLARIASNKAIDMHRARARTGRALTSFRGMLEPLRGEGADNPFDAVAESEERAKASVRIQEVLERINPRYRRAIELRFLNDRRRQSCADLLEIKIGTFDVLLLRALRAFRKEWEALLRERSAS